MSELKNCPFCDSKNISHDEILGKTSDGKYYTQGSCLDCGANGPETTHDINTHLDEQQAIDAWNQRPTPETLHLTLKEGEFRKEKDDGNV